MADNYLEKKFEEYAARKAGRLPRRIAPPTHRSGMAEFRFPRRRVLILGGLTDVGRCIVERLRLLDCRVAVCDNIGAEGQKYAEEAGVRFHAVEPNNSQAVTAAMQTLFHDWGDIDILISLTSQKITEAAVQCLADFRRNGPIPNDYGRIFTFLTEATDYTYLPDDLLAKNLQPSLLADMRLPHLLVLLSTMEAELILRP